MTTPVRDVDVSHYQYSSSPDLSSLPSESPSEPGSPSRQDQRRASHGRRHDEITVDNIVAPRFPLAQQQAAQQPGQMPAFSPDGVRLTKDGVPRKKPGRKPGAIVKKNADGSAPTTPSSLAAAAAAPSSGAEPPKPKRARKPKDPNAPPVPRKKRALPTSAPSDDAPPPVRSSSANMHFEPKVELTSMRMDIDSRPTPHPLGPSAILTSSSLSASSHPPSRQPPLVMMDKMPRRGSHHSSSVMSILNSDDSPPRPPPAAPALTTPVRSVGQTFDPIRSTTYDPVRETMLARDPYGTGPLGSPRGPSQLTNRASASPSIHSLIDPPATSHPHSHSPVGSFSRPQHTSPPPTSNATATNHSNNASLPRYGEKVSSMPPSPSPGPTIRNIAAPPPRPPASASSSSANPTPTTTKPSSAKASPQVTAAAKSTTSAIPPLSLSSKSSAKSSAASKAAAKTDANGKGHSKPPPPPPVPTSSKASASKPTSTKAAEKKAAKAAAAAAAATASAAPTTKAAATSKATESSSSSDSPAPSKHSGPVTTSFKDVAVSAANAASAPHIKKFSSILQQGGGGKQSKTTSSATSTPKMSAAKADALPSSLASLDSSPQAATSEPERSILDFGKVLPGDELATPSIVLHIPLIQGETNKYVNFMRMAEERYGWDALHPRLAAHRDRKLRIAAASAALERNGSGRESGDEMTDDMQSGDEGSNEENGAGGDNAANGVNASGPDDAPVKPARKKRIFKEDEYDKDDDFVDDSEMLWEEQAAASRDGFFVYSGPLVPEEEKPAEGASTPAKRGRGTRGGRGGAGRSAAPRATGRGAGGAGSRGGSTLRKPRATKQEKEQREREKAELEKASAKAVAKESAKAHSPFSSSMVIDG